MNATSSKSRASVSVPPPPAKRQRAKRLPAHERKAIILKEAADFFAEQGFAASTRDLADRIGVRQALLYKYFPSKEALIDAIFDVIIEQRRGKEGERKGEDKAKPLADRIFAYYENLSSLAGGSGTRLASRAALEDLPVTTRLANFLTQTLFMPVIAELRAMESLPDLATRPMMRGEFELLLAFHAGSMFFDLRRRLHNLPLPDDSGAFMHLYVANFVAGARNSLRELHAPGASDALTAPATYPIPMQRDA